MAQNPARVLILVGDDTSRMSIASSLRERRFEVLAYDHVNAALTRLRETPFVPDFVVLDWMPSSAELLRYIVSTPKYVRTRVIVLTGPTDTVPSLCVASVLPKEVQPGDLLQTLEHLSDQAAS